MIRIIRIGEGIDETQVDLLAADLARSLRLSCRVVPEILDPDPAFDPVRGQYWATEILRRLAAIPIEPDDRILGVTSLDLFVPIFTFVFGEAQVGGACGLVSAHRLREEFYGLAGSPDTLRERLLKEALHELGHTFGLRHCREWECVMASTHSVDRLDLKQPRYCRACLGVVRAAAGW